MKLSDLKTIDQIIEEDRSSDPAFAEEWDRTAFARQVAITVIRYRAERGISQRELAAATGLQQPAIARLEIGDSTPSLSTLAKLSRATGLKFHLEIAQGSVAIPSTGRPSSKSVYRVKRSFVVRHQDGNVLTLEELASQRALLSDELGKLERCNDDMSRPAVSSDSKAGAVTVKMTMVASIELDALQNALFICRTAIHAIGGSTPDWPTRTGSKPAADFTPAGFQVEYV